MHNHLKTKRRVSFNWHYVYGVEYSIMYRGTVNAKWSNVEVELRRRDINKYVSNNIKSDYKRKNFEFSIY